MAHVIGQCFPWRLRLVEVISLSQQRLILGSSYPSTPSHLTLTSYVQPRTSRLLPLTSYFSRHIHRLTFLDRLLHDNLAYPHRVRRQRVRREQHEVRQLPNLDRPLSLLFEKLPRRVDLSLTDRLRVDDRRPPVPPRVRLLGRPSRSDHHPDRRIPVGVCQHLPAVLVPVRHSGVQLLLRLERREPGVRGLSTGGRGVVWPAQVRRISLYRPVGQQLHATQAEAPAVP